MYSFRSFRPGQSVFAVCFALCGLLVLVGCGGDSDSDPTTPPPSISTFSGSWSVVFAGSYTGGGTIAIDAEGSCSANVLLSDGTTNFTNTISFNVSSDGRVQNGKIYYSGSQIGTVTGEFGSNSGSGSYQTSQPSSGTWSVTKN